MFNFFKSKNINNPQNPQNPQKTSFAYLNPDALYFDSACQTLRPQVVIDAEVEYYQNFNACGHRVKYPWGKKVDDKVDECRRELLKLVGKSEKDYTVAFCLNATHGVQLVLHQLNPDLFDSITTTNIEHSSVFLPSITWSNKNQKPRTVIDRDPDGSIRLGALPLNPTVFFANTTSNVDGQELLNIQQITKQVHQQKGLVLLDACQTMGHNPDFLKNIEFDAVFGSSHKMYGPSLGFVIIRQDLLSKLDYFMLGGSTIADNDLNSYQVIDEGFESYSAIEAGLQNFAGIIGLSAAIKWRNGWNLKNELPEVFSEINKNLSANEYENYLTQYLHSKLSKISQLKALTSQTKSVVSVYSSKVDGNKLAMYLGGQNIMCRSGYHCCYYYLKHQKNSAPLLRISLGLHNTPTEIDELVKKLALLVAN